MEQMPDTEAEKLVARALDALAEGETPSALALLERALKLSDHRVWYSYLGFCIAKERGQMKKGMELCAASQEAEPQNPVHLLNLAKIYLVAGQKLEALQVLRQAMALGGTPEVVALLNQIGTRKPPVLSFLPRSNVLNRTLGLLLDRMGLR